MLTHASLITIVTVHAKKPQGHGSSTTKPRTLSGKEEGQKTKDLREQSRSRMQSAVQIQQQPSHEETTIKVHDMCDQFLEKQQYMTCRIMQANRKTKSN